MKTLFSKTRTFASLRLFNSIIVDDKNKSNNLKLEQTVKYGFILSPSVASLSNVDSIISYLQQQALDSRQANSTFHKSWSVIKNSSRQELLYHQILHYMSGYGTNFTDHLYIPIEEANLPEDGRLELKVVNSISPEEVIQKCLGLLKTGIALKQETINDIFEIFDSENYIPSRNDIDSIKNRESLMLFVDRYGVQPKNTVEMVRYLVYLATKNTLLIKSPEVIRDIMYSQANISNLLTTHLSQYAQVFNRFKPIFLAFKKANIKNSKAINKISKLSKSRHIPCQTDILSKITSQDISRLKLEKAVDKATNFRKISLLYALKSRINDSSNLMYRIRNGKSWVKEKEYSEIQTTYHQKYAVIYQSLINSLNLKDKKILLDPNVEYAIPQSEKNFLDNIPEGSSILLDKDIVVGIYWESSWGTNDFDLSAIGLEKVGWNSIYNSGEIKYSGDLTRAENGATELLYIKRKITQPTLILNNRFRGNEGSQFKLFVAKENITKLDRGYMVDSKNIICETMLISNKRETNCGILIPHEGKTKFVLTNFESFNLSISGKNNDRCKDFLYHKYSDCLNLTDLLKLSGVQIVKEDPDIDLRVSQLKRDTIINLIG